jgi:hypothetical protein
MRFSCRVIFFVAGKASRKGLINRHGKEFYREFRSDAGKKFRGLLPGIEDIGDSIFKFNYLYIPAYFSWYDALRKRLGSEEAMQEIWHINEDFVKFYPKWVMRAFAKKSYLGTFRKKAPVAELNGKQGKLHPLDWRVEYKDVDKHTFGVNIYECAFLKQAKRLGYMEMFPGVCRMDYLFSHYMDTTFVRTKTLGDGNDCCNCMYTFPGASEWAPEKGFEDRK